MCGGRGVCGGSVEVEGVLREGSVWRERGGRGGGVCGGSMEGGECMECGEGWICNPIYSFN